MSTALAERPAPTNFAAVAPPEVLAPAGDRDCLRAAVENGADAVYFGLQDFNARARATNFDLDELPAIMQWLHRRGVKGYVTLNTLVFPRELDAMQGILVRVAEAGVDAILVQDLGLVRLARAIAPDLPIHASTQMTLTSAESIRLAEELGVERVVLARELSLDEIGRIRRQTRMPLEVFVHGALCVAYSGQCLTSEALGGRSANRGQCAQACRLPYDLVCDGRTRDLGEVQYLLSPQDLAAYAVVPDLVRLGVAALKIEGRLKTPEYVANITRHYRMAVDGAAAGRPVEFTRRAIDEMELSFSRGFSVGWLHGNNHKVLVQGRNPRKHGLFIGEVRAVRRDRVLVQLAGPVKRGDGVVFDRGRPEEPEQGGRVYEVFRAGRSLTEAASTGLVELTFGRDAVDLAAVAAGHRVWKTDDPELTRRLRQSFTGPDAIRRVPIDVRVRAAVGERLHISAHADSGASAFIEGDEPLAVAVRHPLTEPLLREQLGRLGATVYSLRSLTADVAGGPIVPLSVLGKLRHALVRQLDDSADALRRRSVTTCSPLMALRPALADRRGLAAAIDRPAAELRVLCRNLDQLRSATAAGERSVYVDFQDIRQYREAVQTARRARAEIYLATPRIQKPAEGPLFKHLLRHEADGILVRNLGALAYFAARGTPLVADFSLNAANELTTQWLHERGARRVTASYDLNREQLLDLVDAVPPEWFEVVVHQHMPMFHMEHCVFCAVLSPGTNRTNCGRPCDRHDVRLRDRVGMEHPLKADVGCRNTLHNAIPQSAAELVPDLVARGVRHFRIELLDQTAVELERTISLYRDLLAGRTSGRDVWTNLRAMNHIGVTRGPLDQ
jgi:putative protease